MDEPLSAAGLPGSARRKGARRADGEHDFFGGFLFGDVTAGAGADDAFGVEQFVVHGDHENRDIRMLAADVFDQFHPVRMFECQVHDGQVRFGCADHFERAKAFFGFAAHDQVRFALNDFREAFADHGMIVHEQDAPFVLLNCGRFLFGYHNVG